MAKEKPVEIPVLKKGVWVQLNTDDADSTFEIVQADVTFNGTNHVTGRQEINVVLVMERDVP